MVTVSFKCESCDRKFKTESGLEQHCQALNHSSGRNKCSTISSRSYPCPGCSDVFTAQELLRSHQRSKKYSYCKTCDRVFSQIKALTDHCSAVHSPSCSLCARDSSSYELLKAYQGSTDQSFCEECERNSLHERIMQFRCCDCDCDFPNEPALLQHLAEHNHVLSSPLDRVCKECDRQFVDQKALSQHLSSLVHVPLSDVKCVGHKKCKKRFRCPSSLLHHLESGACRSGMDRRKLNKMVCGKDTDREITCGGVGAEIEARAMDSSSVTIDTLRTLHKQLPAVRIKMKCPLCPARKAFRTLDALRNHLSSPAHAPKRFHCPSSFVLSRDATNVSSPMKYFSTLSGLTQHLESGACEGGKATFLKTVVYVEERLNQLGLGDLRLL